LFPVECECSPREPSRRSWSLSRTCLWRRRLRRGSAPQEGEGDRPRACGGARRASRRSPKRQRTRSPRAVAASPSRSQRSRRHRAPPKRQRARAPKAAAAEPQPEESPPPPGLEPGAPVKMKRTRAKKPAEAVEPGERAAAAAAAGRRELSGLALGDPAVPPAGRSEHQTRRPSHSVKNEGRLESKRRRSTRREIPRRIFSRECLVISPTSPIVFISRGSGSSRGSRCGGASSRGGGTASFSPEGGHTGPHFEAAARRPAHLPTQATPAAQMRSSD
jgi:hypothetical protein